MVARVPVVGAGDRARARARWSASGLDPEALEVREIRDDADAEREGFPGSPTIRVDGRDVQDPGDEPVGLTCRVYRLRDGRHLARCRTGRRSTPRSRRPLSSERRPR